MELNLGALQHRSLAALVKDILDHYSRYTWTIQGFGMLRTYFGSDREYRLHIWDDRYRVPNVTLLHDHPWDFQSLIIAGEVEQFRYWEWGTDAQIGEAYVEETIQCGEGGFACNTTRDVRLEQLPLERYEAGEVYRQSASEIHCSLPLNGTVTLIERSVPDGSSPDHAHVFYRPEIGWVSAEPRPATEQEIFSIVTNSLATWF